MVVSCLSGHRFCRLLSRLTKHATLFVYKRAEVAKNLGELVYASLDFSNLGFTLLDEGFLVCKFMWRELGLHCLGLQLLRCSFRVMTRPTTLEHIRSFGESSSLYSRRGILLHRQLDILYNCAQFLGAYLLGPLKRNK